MVQPGQHSPQAKHNTIPVPHAHPPKGHPLGPPHPQAPRSHPISGFHSSPRLRLRQSRRAEQLRERERLRERHHKQRLLQIQASRAFTQGPSDDQTADSRQQTAADKQAAENATETAGREVGPGRDKPRPFFLTLSLCVRVCVCVCVRALEDRQLAASRENRTPKTPHSK